MNWARWRSIPWIDTRAKFVAEVPYHGSLLDLGSSDGQTLCHMWQLRPDLKFASVDIGERPARTPPNTDFTRADLETDSLPWLDNSFDAITCMHVVEHLRTTKNFWREVARLLKPGPGLCGDAWTRISENAKPSRVSSPKSHHEFLR